MLGVSTLSYFNIIFKLVQQRSVKKYDIVLNFVSDEFFVSKLITKVTHQAHLKKLKDAMLMLWRVMVGQRYRLVDIARLFVRKK